MKFTYDWLKDYLKTKANPVEIAETLTRIGLEVEDLIEPVSPVAAKIIECVDVPDTHLHKLMVDDGTGKLRQVVCGAPNARVGLVSALALPGCRIGDVEIKSGKIRGIESNGMMCSGKELGINNDHDGIIGLDEKTVKIGLPIMEYQLQSIFEAGITPNRPDYLSVYGIARDLAASGVGTFIRKYDNYAGKFNDGIRNARIENYAACPVYYLCEIKNIKMAQSNPKIAARLAAIGINPRNAAIDATNYICYDLGQPMHCFDADKVNGDIIIRNAKSGEKFTDLFGNEHELVNTDLVIADGNGVLALAGVIGGERSMTTGDTKNIILESAYFDPVCIRKTSKRIGVSTDASYRYERGINPTIAFLGIMQAAKIITDVCGGDAETPFRDWDKTNPKLAYMSHKMVDNELSDSETSKILDPRRIKYSPELFLKKTGIVLAADRQKKILESLGFYVDVKKSEWIITPSPSRVEIEIPEHIVSELLRLYGYDKIAQVSHNGSEPIGLYQGLNLGTKRMLASRGLSEHKSFGFGNAENEQLLFDKQSVLIANPITADFDTARNNLLGGMLDAIAQNEKRGFADVNMFELGTVFDGVLPGQQHTQLVIARTGMRSPKHWMRRNRAADVFDVKADVLALFGAQNLTVSMDEPPKWAHPYRYGRIMQGKKIVAEFGELHPMIAKHFKIKTNVCIALVDDVSVLPQIPKAKQTPITEFQPITRDFAFITDADFDAQKIITNAKSADSRIFDITVFDAFEMGDGKKSIAFTITIIPNENFGDAELQTIQKAVIERVEKNCPAKIRDK